MYAASCYQLEFASSVGPTRGISRGCQIVHTAADYMKPSAEGAQQSCPAHLMPTKDRRVGLRGSRWPDVAPDNATHLWTIAAACGASAILLNLMVHRPQSSVVQGDTSAVGYPRRRIGARASMGGPKPRSGPNPLSCFLGRGCPASVEVVLDAEETGAWVTGWPSYSPRASCCPKRAVLYLHLIACQFRADS